MSPDMTRLGEEVRQLRRERGWSQHELATEAGVSRASVARLEAGSDTSTATLVKVVTTLGAHIQLNVL